MAEDYALCAYNRAGGLATEDKIQIRTKFNIDRIISEVQYPQYQSDFSNIVANTASRVLELQEKGIQEALAKLGYVKQEWISVKDRLPEVEDGADAVKVLVYYNCAISHTMKIGATYFWKDSLSLPENGLPGGFELLGVTHWMPLPEPPK